MMAKSGNRRSQPRVAAKELPQPSSGSVLERAIATHKTLNKHVRDYQLLLLKIAKSVENVGEEFDVVLAGIDKASRDERASDLLSEVIVSALIANAARRDLAARAKRQSDPTNSGKPVQPTSKQPSAKAGQAPKTKLRSGRAESRSAIEARFKSLFRALDMLDDAFEGFEDEGFNGFEDFLSRIGPALPNTPEPNSIEEPVDHAEGADKLRLMVQACRVAIGLAGKETLDPEGIPLLAHISFMIRGAQEALPQMRRSLGIMEIGQLATLHRVSNSRKASSAPKYQAFVIMLNAYMIKAVPEAPETHRLAFLATMATVLFGGRDKTFSADEIRLLLDREMHVALSTNCGPLVLMNSGPPPGR